MRRTGAALAAGLCAVALAAGCSSSKPTHDPGSQSAPPTVGTGSPTTGGSSTDGSRSSSGSARLIDVCATLPVARASAIVGKPFTSAKGNTAAGFLTSCEYDGGLDLLQITITTQYGEHELQNDVDALTQVGHPPTKITGVGDDAFSEPDPNGNAGAEGAADSASYGAVFGDTYIKIGGMWVSPTQGQQIVELLHAAM